MLTYRQHGEKVSYIMEELRRFQSSEFGELGILLIDGKEYFPATQCAKIIGHQNPERAVRKYCKGVTKMVTPTDGGSQEINYIPEGDLYRLIVSSKLPAAEKFESWVFDEVLPSIRKTGSYTYQRANPNEEKVLQIQEMDTRIRMSEQFLKLAEIETTLSKNYRDILISKSVEALAGEQLLPLLKVVQKTYSAKEVGEMFGITAQRIGRIANLNNMKTDEFGEFYKDKSPYSSKEVDVFRYNDKAVGQFKKLLA